MKIMYITTSLKTPNGVCAANVIEALMKVGHEVLVFTEDNIGKEVRCPCQVIYSKHHSLHYLEQQIRMASRGRIARNAIDFLYRIWIVLCYPIWPINSPLFFSLFSREARKVARKNNVDMVISEYGDLVCLNAGRIIKNFNNQIKTVAYFIDALYCGAKPSHMSEKTKSRLALYWENKMLCNYDKVIMMEATRDKYCEILDKIGYGEKIVFLDIPMLKPCVSKAIFNNRDFLKFVYLGSMPKNIRDPKHLLELYKKINNPRWKLYIYGSNEYIDLIDKYKDYNVEYNGIVPHEKALQILQDADFLINIGNSFPEMVPSKIFEYIATNKPIISTFKIQKDPCIRYLAYYKNAICLDENNPISDNAEKLVKYVKSYDNNVLEPNQSDYIMKLTALAGPLYKNTPEAVVDCLEEYNDSTRQM